MNTSYSNFLTTHPPILFGEKDPLDADDWLCTTESKFSLLHCIEYQKTLYVTQQLRGPIGEWWASFIAALLADHHVAWDESSHSAVTTCQRALCAVSWLGSSSYTRGTILCMTTLRSLTTWHSMVGTMLTAMLRRLSSIARASIFSCRTA
jgi:hypothetical protein